jgi:hypothetical protein
MNATVIAEAPIVAAYHPAIFSAIMGFLFFCALTLTIAFGSHIMFLLIASWRRRL